MSVRPLSQPPNDLHSVRRSASGHITTWPTGYIGFGMQHFGYLPIWLGSVISAAQQSALAWRSRACQLQAEHYCTSLLAGESSKVAGWLLHSSFGSHWLSITSRHHLTVPHYRLSISGRRAFSVTGPTSWNSLTHHLCDPTPSSVNFSSKTNYLRVIKCTWRSRDDARFCAI